MEASTEAQPRAVLASAAESSGALTRPSPLEDGLGVISPGHYRSPPLSATAGRSAHRSVTESRSGSTPGSLRIQTSGGARASQEVLTAVSRKLEAVEEKLGYQIVKSQQQGDRLRDAALSRVDAKIVNMEQMQPKFDRRLAELSGNYKGLSDEMQTQIRRIDMMDSRLWEWRHQLEEDMRTKLTEIEHNHQQLTSSSRMTNAASDEALKRYSKRLLRIESLVEERLAGLEEATQSIMNLHNRLLEVEEGRVGKKEGLLALATSRLEPGPLALANDSGDVAALAELEARVGETSQAIRTSQQESRDISSRLEAQEERLRSLRTLVEAKEDHYRFLSERVERTDFEGRFKEVRGLLQELDRRSIGTEEQLALLQRRFSSLEETQDELGSLRVRPVARSRADDSDTSPAHSAHSRGQHVAAAPSCDDGAMLAVDLAECVSRLDRTEARLGQLATEVGAVGIDTELAPRVGLLVDQLKQVAPKVVDQEMGLRELTERVGRLEVEVRICRAAGDGRAEGGAAWAPSGAGVSIPYASTRGEDSRSDVRRADEASSPLFGSRA